MIVGAADGNNRLAGLYQPGRNGIFPGLVPELAGAHQLPVPVSFIPVVHRAQAQRELLSCPIGRDFHGFAEPVNAVGGRPEFLHHAGKRHGFPGSVVKVRTGPYGHASAFAKVFQTGFPVERRKLFIEGLFTLRHVVGEGFDMGEGGGHLRISAERLFAHPGLDDGAAPAAVDDSHGDVQLFHQLEAEVPGRGREVADGFGGRLLPFVKIGTEIVMFPHSRGPGHLEKAHIGILGRAGDILLVGPTLVAVRVVCPVMPADEGEADGVRLERLTLRPTF